MAKRTKSPTTRPESRETKREPRLLDRVRGAMRVRHLKWSTEKSYIGWIRRDRFQAKKLIRRAELKKWVVDRRERYAHGEGVAAYLARYVRGGPLKNRRLLDLAKEKQTVTFRVSRQGEKFLKMELGLREFIRRILLHVPPIGYRVVRACGLYHHHYADLREACREQLGGGSPPAEVEPPEVDESDEPEDESWDIEDDYCPVCGCRLEVEAIPRGPPPADLARYEAPNS